jgi:hypothetical protein
VGSSCREEPRPSGSAGEKEKEQQEAQEEDLDDEQESEQDSSCTEAYVNEKKPAERWRSARRPSLGRERWSPWFGVAQPARAA